MSERPGRIVLKREVDIPRPRDLDTTFEPEFVDLVHELRGRISQARMSDSGNARRSGRPGRGCDSGFF